MWRSFVACLIVGLTNDISQPMIRLLMWADEAKVLFTMNSLV